jgi:hypothetical protein
MPRYETIVECAPILGMSIASDSERDIAADSGVPSAV